MQNGFWGVGSICGASVGGLIADKIGWRWCFLLQVPISVMALTVGILVVQNQPSGFSLDSGLGAMWKRVDFTGALLLTLGVSVQLVGLSMGGNELPWDSPWVIGSLVTSFVLLGLFLVVESRTSAIPIIPLRMLKGRLPVATQISNISAGFAAFGVCCDLYGCKVLTRLTGRLVHLHPSALLPGRPLRLSVPSQHAPCYSCRRDPYRRHHCWCRNVPLRQTPDTHEDWHYFDGTRQRTRDVLGIFGC